MECLGLFTPKFSEFFDSGASHFFSLIQIFSVSVSKYLIKQRCLRTSTF